jgi:hypothetical protein
MGKLILGGKMLIKNSRMMINRILKSRKIWIRRAPAAVLLGCCALLSGSPLYAQDLLLKEYIYLDGKLLAVERQILTQTAQQSAGDSGKEMEFAQYSPSSIHGLTPPGSSCKPGISGIPGMQETYAFHSPVIAKFLCPDNGPKRLVGSEDFNLQYGTYRRHLKVAGIFEHENGGSYDGL